MAALACLCRATPMGFGLSGAIAQLRNDVSRRRMGSVKLQKWRPLAISAWRHKPPIQFSYRRSSCERTSGPPDKHLLPTNRGNDPTIGKSAQSSKSRHTAVNAAFRQSRLNGPRSHSLRDLLVRTDRRRPRCRANYETQMKVSLTYQFSQPICSFVTTAINPTDCAAVSPSWRARQAYGGSFDFCGGY